MRIAFNDLLHGLKVGKVKKIRIQPEGSIIVDVRLYMDVKIPVHSQFLVEDSSLFGGKQLSILEPADPPDADLSREVWQSTLTIPDGALTISDLKTAIESEMDTSVHIHGNSEGMSLPGISGGMAETPI